MASNEPRATSSSTLASAAAMKPSRSRFMTAGDNTLLSTARVRVCAGGSASRIRLGGRHGVSLAKSLRPTPRLEQKVKGSFRTA